MNKELNHLAIEAARLLSQKHKGLRSSESIRIGFVFRNGVRRVELRLANNNTDEVTEFFVDVPDMQDRDAVDLGLDFLDGVLGEHLSSNREAIPRLDPSPYRFEGHTVYLCGGTRHPKLETTADSLLQKNK